MATDKDIVEWKRPREENPPILEHLIVVLKDESVVQAKYLGYGVYSTLGKDGVIIHTDEEPAIVLWTPKPSIYK